MTLSTKDLVGACMVVGTLAILVVHNGPFGHMATHRSGVADAGGSETSAVGERPIAFVDFNVVPMNRDVVLRRQVVVVRGSFIERVGRVGLVEPPPNALRIEGDGTHYLVPGLTDSHVHLQDRPESWLPLFLATGVTTVFNLEGNPSHIALRDRIGSGDEPGPTVYTAGPYLGDFPGEAQARAAVDRQVERGYNFLKVRGALSADVYRAITEAARSRGVPVVGHAPRSLPFSEVLSGGQLGLTHAEELIQARLWTLDANELASAAQEMAEAGMWMTPTLAYFGGAADQWASPQGVGDGLATAAAGFLPARLRARWREANPFAPMDSLDRARIREMHEFHGPLLRELHAAGVPILAGTDAPLPLSVPGFSLHDEIAALREIGLSGFEALATATRNPGEFVREHVEDGARFGTIEPLARADILEVEGDPRRDPSVLRRPIGVMVRGRWYGRGDLDRMLTEVSRSR